MISLRYMQPIFRIDPRYGILLSIFGTAILSIYPEPNTPIVPFTRIITLAVQALGFLIVLPSIKLRFKGIPLFILLAWLGLFLWSLMSGFWTFLPELTFQRAAITFIPALSILLLVYNDSKPIETFWNIAKGMVAFGTFLSFFAVFTYIFGATAVVHGVTARVLNFGPIKLAQTVFDPTGLPRISSLTPNPNGLASWLIITLMMTVALYLAHRISSKVFLVLWPLQATALILTFSRAGIGVAIVATFLFTYLSTQNNLVKLKKIVRPVLAITGIFIIMGFLLGMHGNLQNGFLGRLSLSSVGRESAWIIAWRSFSKLPLTGVGFGVSYEALFRPAGLQITAHNAYLSVLTEIGLGGLLLFIGIWVGALIASWRKISLFNKLGLTDESVAMITVFTLLVSLIPHQMFESLIPRFSFYTLFWAYLVGLATHSLHRDSTLAGSENYKHGYSI